MALGTAEPERGGLGVAGPGGPLLEPFTPRPAARGNARRQPLRGVQPSEPAADGVSRGAGARGGEWEPKPESPRLWRPMGWLWQRGRGGSVAR